MNTYAIYDDQRPNEKGCRGLEGLSGLSISTLCSEPAEAINSGSDLRKGAWFFSASVFNMSTLTLHVYRALFKAPKEMRLINCFFIDCGGTSARAMGCRGIRI